MSVFTNNIVNENGEQFIPATQRPDGTWRKARRVKDGYVPQEEVPLYESKGKQIMNKHQGPVTLPSGQIALRPIPGLVIIQDDNDKKPVKKKNKKKIEDLSDHVENLKISANVKSNDNKPTKKLDKKVESQTDLSKPTEATDPQKKLKNLKKRLREVEALEEKLANGIIAKPEPDQLAKIKRKSDLIVQIHELEKQLR